MRWFRQIPGAAWGVLVALAALAIRWLRTDAARDARRTDQLKDLNHANDIKDRVDRSRTVPDRVRKFQDRGYRD